METLSAPLDQGAQPDSALKAWHGHSVILRGTEAMVKVGATFRIWHSLRSQEPLAYRSALGDRWIWRAGTESVAPGESGLEKLLERHGQKQ